MLPENEKKPLLSHVTPPTVPVVCKLHVPVKGGVVGDMTAEAVPTVPAVPGVKLLELKLIELIV